jgi:hypothetical protein
LVPFASKTEREDYSRRIMQRLGVSVEEYSVLNIHRIGVAAPVRYVFEELFANVGDSLCWPNHVATLQPVSGGIEEIRVFLLGGPGGLFGRLRRIFGPGFGTLFRLNAVRIQHLPNPADFDNARYMLFRCSGGYPVGILVIYVRSPIAEKQEPELAQLFFAVSFNFYGKKNWPLRRLANRVWEGIHNRVTANVLNRYKQLCEARFDEVRAGMQGPPVRTGGPEVYQPTFSEIDFACRNSSR